MGWRRSVHFGVVAKRNHLLLAFLLGLVFLLLGFLLGLDLLGRARREHFGEDLAVLVVLSFLEGVDGVELLLGSLVCGVQRQHPLQVRPPLLQLPQQPQRLAAAEEALEAVGLEVQRLVRLGEGVVEALHLVEAGGLVQVAARLHLLHPLPLLPLPLLVLHQLESTVILGQRRLQVPLLEQRVAEGLAGVGGEELLRELQLVRRRHLLDVDDELDVGPPRHPQLRVALLPERVVGSEGDEGALALLDLLQAPLQPLAHRPVPDGEGALLWPLEHRASLPRHPTLYHHRHPRPVVAQRPVRVQLAKALDHDAPVLVHVVDGIPVEELHLVLHRGVGGDEGGEAEGAEGVLGGARDQRLRTLLHLLADRSLHPHRQPGGGAAELDEEGLLLLLEDLTVAARRPLQQHLVPPVRVPPPAPLLRPRAEEDAAVRGDLLLVPPQQLHLELEGGVARDLVAAALGAVAIVGADRQHRLLSLLHRRHPCVPALDDLALAELERERRLSVPRGVELAAVALQRAHIVHAHVIIFLRHFLPLSLHQNLLQHAAVARKVRDFASTAQPQ
mmetsp:Transcript_23593/g.56293  ORF Transcript_23593/g.56293 Transcript_23593/m.56293 type:complete len:559 (+) Transcript_23593:100-1776(+)